MTTMPARPTPSEFSQAVATEVVEPALEAVSGTDGRTSRSEAGRIAGLSGRPALAGPAVDAYFDSTGYGSSKTTRVADGISAATMQDASRARRSDGTVDPRRLPARLQVLYRELGGAEASSRPRYSQAVVDRLMGQYGLTDEAAFIAEARRHDDGNGYLKTSELEAAARVLSGAAHDLGIISDLDKTIIPEHGDTLPASPYPGIAQLLVELEGVDGNAGDLTFVTARTPDSAAPVPQWLRRHGVPEGPIETGVSGVPWVARREKVADISRAFDASPDKSFVLFGDSSHVDPDAYRDIREKYGDRVRAAFIHRVTNNVDPARVEGLHLIENYAEAAAVLLGAGVLDRAAAERVMVAAQINGLDITDRQIERLLG
ncbi:MAG: DUF2183 domain-containing protein [Deltaproteobacteria bacterium]